MFPKVGQVPTKVKAQNLPDPHANTYQSKNLTVVTISMTMFAGQKLTSRLILPTGQYASRTYESKHADFSNI